MVASIERQVGEETGQSLEEVSETVKVRERDPIGFIEVGRIVFGQYPRRSVLGLALFIGQAFLYNAVFFTYALVLTTFYKVNAASVGLYLIAFAVGNFAGPLLLGRLFDTVGRRKMIAGTYLLSGVMLGVTAALFNAGTLSATTQTIAWVVVFFFASAGATRRTLRSARYSQWRRVPSRLRSSTQSARDSGGSSVPSCSAPLLRPGKLRMSRSAMWSAGR